MYYLISVNHGYDIEINGPYESIVEAEEAASKIENFEHEIWTLDSWILKKVKEL